MKSAGCFNKNPLKGWCLSLWDLEIFFTFASRCDPCNIFEILGESSSGVEHHLAKVRVAGSNPVFRSLSSARVVELVDTLDLKSNGHCGRAGSSPASSTKKETFERSSPFFIFIFLGLFLESTFHCRQFIKFLHELMV